MFNFDIFVENSKEKRRFDFCTIIKIHTLVWCTFSVPTITKEINSFIKKHLIFILIKINISLKKNHFLPVVTAIAILQAMDGLATADLKKNCLLSLLQQL